MLYLNVVWPAIYVSGALGQFWFLILATMLIETLAVKFLLNYAWKKSIQIAVVGNLVSGLLGTFVMVFAMLGWHFVMDGLVPGATFGSINWIATYVLMCLGSVFIETLAVKLMFKIPIKKLFLPLLIGNLLSYLFILGVSLMGS